MKPMPHRQIHMDFHTSPLIPGIGEKFDADAFGKALQDARASSTSTSSANATTAGSITRRRWAPCTRTSRLTY